MRRIEEGKAAALPARSGPPPRAVKRPSRFPVKIHSVWEFCIGRAGRVTAQNGGSRPGWLAGWLAGPGRKRERGLREGYLDLDGPMPRKLRQRLFPPSRAWKRRYFVVTGLRQTFGKAGHAPELLCYAQHSQVSATTRTAHRAPRWQVRVVALTAHHSQSAAARPLRRWPLPLHIQARLAFQRVPPATVHYYGGPGLYTRCRTVQARGSGTPDAFEVVFGGASPGEQWAIRARPRTRAFWDFHPSPVAILICMANPYRESERQ
jgi:hypothetical protein